MYRHIWPPPCNIGSSRVQIPLKYLSNNIQISLNLGTLVILDTQRVVSQQNSRPSITKASRWSKRSWWYVVSKVMLKSPRTAWSFIVLKAVLRSKITNDTPVFLVCHLDILMEAGLIQVTCIVRERQFRLYGPVARLPAEDPAHRILSCRGPRGWSMLRGRRHASWLRQVESYLKDSGMAVLASAWAMCRRRPREYRRKVDTATRCSGVCFHIWPDLTPGWCHCEHFHVSWTWSDSCVISHLKILKTDKLQSGRIFFNNPMPCWVVWQ